jgi:hypothetical protein
MFLLPDSAGFAGPVGRLTGATYLSNHVSLLLRNLDPVASMI